MCAARGANYLRNRQLDLRDFKIYAGGGQTSRFGRNKTSFGNETSVLPPPGKGRLNIDEICAPADFREKCGDAKTDQMGGPGCPGTAWGNDHFVQQGWINDRLPDETP